MYNTLMTKSKDYQINEKDIDGIIKFLKTIDPENATPEMAIDLLEHLHATVHTMTHENPEELKKIYEELKHQREMSRN